MMVDLEGQQRGLLTKAFWKLLPFSTNCLVVCGMYVGLRSSFRMSSVRMKIMLGCGVAAVWAGATGAFHNISATTQAAAAATPTINMSAKRACQVRWLLACIFPTPFYLQGEGLPTLIHNEHSLHDSLRAVYLSNGYLSRPEWASSYARWLFQEGF